MKHKTPAPLNMFSGTAQDTPLFSGTAQRVTMQTYNPQPTQQPGLFTVTCPICYGTGTVKPYRNKPARPCPVCSQH